MSEIIAPLKLLALSLQLGHMLLMCICCCICQRLRALLASEQLLEVRRERARDVRAALDAAAGACEIMRPVANRKLERELQKVRLLSVSSKSRWNPFPTHQPTYERRIEENRILRSLLLGCGCGSTSHFCRCFSKQCRSDPGRSLPEQHACDLRSKMFWGWVLSYG